MLKTIKLAECREAAMAAKTNHKVATPVDNEGCLNAVTELETKDLAFEMLKHGDYLDGVTLFACFDDGAVLLLQVIVSNIGLYTHEPGLAVKYWNAKGERTYVGEKYSRHDIKLEDDNASISFKDVALKWDTTNKCYRVTVGGGVSSKFKLNLLFENALDPSSGTHGLKIGKDSHVYFGTDRHHYFQQAYCMLRARVSGSLVVNGTPVSSTGFGFAGRSTQNIKPHKMATHWAMFKLITPESSIQLNTFYGPRELGDKVEVSQGWFVHENKLVAVTIDNTTDVLDSQYDPQTHYCPPTRLRHILRGTTLDTEEQFEATVEIRPQQLLDKFDVLAALPWILRVIIKTFIARPYYYQWFDDVVVHIRIGDREPFQVAGRAFHEFIYVNPEHS